MIDLSHGNPYPSKTLSSFWEQCMLDAVNDTTSISSVLHYDTSLGQNTLIQFICDYFNNHYQWDITTNHILITNGNKHSISLVCDLFASPSSSFFLLKNPEYPGFSQAMTRYNSSYASTPTIRELPEFLFEYVYDSRILESIPKDTSLILYSNPNNPTGDLLNIDMTSQLNQWAKDNHCHIFIDGAYSEPFTKLHHHPHHMPFSSNTLYSFGFSKIGIPGLRIGVLIGDPEIIKPLHHLQQKTMIQTNSLSQNIVSKAFSKPQFETLAYDHLFQKYLNNFQLVHDFFKSLSPTQCKLHRFNGGQFAWLWLNHPSSSIQSITEDLLLLDLKLSCGSHYFFKNTAALFTSCLRISLNTDKHTLIQGLEIFKTYYLFHFR